MRSLPGASPAASGARVSAQAGWPPVAEGRWGAVITAAAAALIRGLPVGVQFAPYHLSGSSRLPDGLLSITRPDGGAAGEGVGRRGPYGHCSKGAVRRPALMPGQALSAACRHPQPQPADHPASVRRHLLHRRYRRWRPGEQPLRPRGQPARLPAPQSLRRVLPRAASPH